jgi:hypothetical protein
MLFSEQLRKLARGVFFANPNFGGKFKLNVSSPK